MALNGWHPGERAIHTKLGHDDDYRVMNIYREVEGELSGDMVHAFKNMLQFVPVVTLDAEGRPWNSMLVGERADIGFVQNPKHGILRFDVRTWRGDPILENLEKSFVGDGEEKSMLVAAVGVDFSRTKQRIKVAGQVEKYEIDGDFLKMEAFVTQGVWNCPKYIVNRNLQPHLATNPTVAHERLHLAPDERLPPDLIAFILDADTVFFGTSYEAPANESAHFPSHLGINERSGRRGFVRVMPSDGRTLVLPDYSGNRYMTSLGNIEHTPFASLTFVSFTTGAILYITGTAQNHYPPSSHSIMPFQHLLTTIRTTGYVFIMDAFPLRQRPSPEWEAGEKSSIYSPPIKYLAEEMKARGAVLLEDTGRPKSDALLTKIKVHSSDIVTLTWEVSEELQITPGQAIIMDFSPLLGPQRYQHMAPYHPSSVNDDRLRTWTVTSTSEEPSRTFSLTIREKSGGSVTGALFAITRKLLEARPELLEDARGMGLKVGVVGVTGHFVLPPNEGCDGSRRKLLWVAGGIGITPFLAMLNGLAKKSGCSDNSAGYDIQLVLSTREPQAILPLISSAISTLSSGQHRITLDVFSHKSIPDIDPTDAEHVVLRRHEGRIGGELAHITAAGGNAKDRRVYVCGPPQFEKAVIDVLRNIDGVDAGAVRTEGFGY